MRALEGELLLAAWESASSSGTGPKRAVALLAAACEGRTRDELMELSVAERDLELLRLRQISFGDLLRGSLPCEVCRTRLEFEVSVESMISRLERMRPLRETPVAAGWFTLVMRPVNSRDLSEAVAAADPRRHLLTLSTAVVGSDTLVVDAVAMCEDEITEQFNRLNEGAETRFTLPCPDCGVSGQVDLDIARFVWMEVRYAALTILREVHELASAYGWMERTILDMSAARRATYLEMARA
jgi:hypothetical protein